MFEECIGSVSRMDLTWTLPTWSSVNMTFLAGNSRLAAHDGSSETFNLILFLRFLSAIFSPVRIHWCGVPQHALKVRSLVTDHRCSLLWSAGFFRPSNFSPTLRQIFESSACSRTLDFACRGRLFAKLGDGLGRNVTRSGRRDHWRDPHLLRPEIFDCPDGAPSRWCR